MKKIIFVLILLFVFVNGCRELDWEDFACDSDEDCVIKSYPYCSGGKMEVREGCINKNTKPPAYIYCKHKNFL